MTAEQLQTVRAERWRHLANPLLTADDARAWLDAAGLTLFLPRRQQFLAPAPSFVEACAGAPSETPSREAIDNAASLMHRLAAEGAILPLNLFGTPSETPDFLASREAFPYLYSLRGTRDWKTEPAGKSSPLVIEIWKHLEKNGPATPGEIQSALGRELTEAAVIRGLMELWSNLRVLPEFEGAKTRWSLTQARFKTELNAAAKTSQTTALSALVSLYLESVLAATSEEVETFLSPLTARSRVRETVNGLVATRQISLVPVGTQSMFHIAGALPEFAEPEVAEAVAAVAEGSEAPAKPRQADRLPRLFDRGAKPFERKPFERKTGERKTFGRKAVERGAAPRPLLAEGAGASGSSDGESKPWPRKEGGERKPFVKKPAFGKKPFDKAARPFRRDAKPFEGERPAGGERAAGGERPASWDRAGSEKRSGFRPAARGGSPAGRRAGGGNFPPKRFGSKPAGGKFESRGDGPPRSSSRFTPRPDGAGSERRPAASGDRPRTFRPRPAGAGSDGERPRTFRPREGGAEKRSSGFAGKSKFGGPKKFGGAKPGGFKPGGAKFGGKPADGEKRPFFRKRPEAAGAGESRPRTYSRPAFEDKASGRSGAPSRSSGRSAGGWKDKPADGSRFAKPGGSYARPAADGAERPRAARPASGRATSSRPASSRPAAGRPAFGGSDRPAYSKPPFAKSGFSKGKPGGSSFGGKKLGGKPAGGGAKFGGAKKFGGPKNFAPRKPGSKPGGARPPFRKRKDEGGTKAE